MGPEIQRRVDENPIVDTALRQINDLSPIYKRNLFLHQTKRTKQTQKQNVCEYNVTVQNITL
jgi:hypothetical protein